MKYHYTTLPEFPSPTGTQAICNRDPRHSTKSRRPGVGVSIPLGSGLRTTSLSVPHQDLRPPLTTLFLIRTKPPLPPNRGLRSQDLNRLLCIRSHVVSHPALLLSPILFSGLIRAHSAACGAPALTRLRSLPQDHGSSISVFLHYLSPFLPGYRPFCSLTSPDSAFSSPHHPQALDFGPQFSLPDAHLLCVLPLPSPPFFLSSRPPWGLPSPPGPPL